MNKDDQISITKYDLLFESRLSKVESTMDNINTTLNDLKSDFKWLFIFTMGGFAGLFALIAHGFKWY